jgi:conjugative relaxase-like TrwC/TraI family protein
MLSCGPTQMLTISKSLSAGQARTYHAREFTSERQNYWSRDQQGHSEWQGSLAKEWGLHGNVGAEEFARLSEGRHPESDAQLVKHQPARTYDNRYGKQITSSEHRAGWDATFSAPKSVSLTALVGGDDRVREAHRESVRVALHELERYTQARIGNIHAPETTGKFIAATFEHDTARPVDGYAAPQRHTHAVVFNVTERENGQTNTLTVVRGNGEQATYDPRRQVGVSVYREQEKRFSVGDRIQFTAPNQELKIANRDLGTVESIGRDGQMRLRLDHERRVDLNPQRHPHLDHGYAVTSYSSQGQTAERVLVNVDTELAAKDLLNSRMAYVSISRGQFDAQIFTDSLEKLPKALGHDVSHQSAYKPEQAIAIPQQHIVPTPTHDKELSIGFGLSL